VDLLLLNLLGRLQNSALTQVLGLRFMKILRKTFRTYRAARKRLPSSGIVLEAIMPSSTEGPQLRSRRFPIRFLTLIRWCSWSILIHSRIAITFCVNSSLIFLAIMSITAPRGTTAHSR
jgi:hypothetical protein